MWKTRNSDLLINIIISSIHPHCTLSFNLSIDYFGSPFNLTLYSFSVMAKMHVKFHGYALLLDVTKIGNVFLSS